MQTCKSSSTRCSSDKCDSFRLPCVRLLLRDTSLCLCVMLTSLAIWSFVSRGGGRGRRRRHQAWCEPRSEQAPRPCWQQSIAVNIPPRSLENTHNLVAFGPGPRLLPCFSLLPCSSAPRMTLFSSFVVFSTLLLSVTCLMLGRVLSVGPCAVVGPPRKFHDKPTTHGVSLDAGGFTGVWCPSWSVVQLVSAAVPSHAYQCSLQCPVLYFEHKWWVCGLQLIPARGFPMNGLPRDPRFR